MKLKTAICALALTMILSGCGSLSGGHNIDSGFAYIESHQYDNALESFSVAEEKGEDACLIHRGRGIAYLYKNEYELAVNELLASLATDEGIVDDMDFDTNYYLAEAYYKLGEYNKAKEVYDAIIGLRSKDSNAYYLRGTAELAAGDHDLGYADFTKAISLNPKDYSMMIMICKSLDEQGYGEEGRSILSKAMENGSDFMSNYERGQIYFYLGDYQSAVQYLETASNERDQDKEPVILMLGHTLETMGDYSTACSKYSNYLRDNPNSAVVYNRLGMCQIKLADYESAVASFEAGIAIDDKAMNQALTLNQITAYEYMGEFNLASSLMTTYLETYPEDETAIRENIFLSTR